MIESSVRATTSSRRVINFADRQTNDHKLSIVVNPAHPPMAT